MADDYGLLENWDESDIMNDVSGPALNPPAVKGEIIPPALTLAYADFRESMPAREVDEFRAEDVLNAFGAGWDAAVDWLTWKPDILGNYRVCRHCGRREPKHVPGCICAGGQG